MLVRTIENDLIDKLNSNKVIILLGARQIGKTTLLKKIQEIKGNVLWLNADEPDVQAMFENASSSKLKAFIGDYKTVIIDEAQRIKNIGLSLKLIHDTYPEIQLIATGSSAFELANKVNEPLTGRKWEMQMFPLSFQEMVNAHGLLTEKRLLDHRLVYGYYPEVVTANGNEQNILKALSDSYLYKDILLLEGIKKPEKLVKLMQALAFQVGNQVSYNELSQTVGLDNKTIESYIALLEKTFVIFKLGTFSRNLRSELKFTRKIYFYDNGIRNALIGNYQLPALRTDIGALWENFIISERMKRNVYSHHYANSYFWRTKEQNEVDIVEDYNGELSAFECKWNTKRNNKISLSFRNAYPDAKLAIITPDNYEDYVMY